MAKLGFIGTGNMGGALAIAAAKNPENELMLSNRHREKAETLADSIGGTVTDNVNIADSADYIFLGVKPQMLDEMAKEIRDTLKKRKSPFVIVSMIAGKTMEEVRRALGGEYALIRILPNIPVKIGEGIILWDRNAKLSEKQLEGFLSAMKYAGLLSEIGEGQMDAASCISGCGPAYAAMFIEALADGAVTCGLPRAKAMEYAAQMVSGTAKLLLETGQHPGQLKDAVCSPGGTTIQGVRALEKNGFRSSVTEAVIASFEKTVNLG